MSLSITQEEVDAVASFVEAANELDLEPFFGKDEQFTQSGSAEYKIIYRLGDRFHFRSALISYRRIWMVTEPSHWRSVGGILTRSGLPPDICQRAALQLQQIDQYISKPDAYLDKEIVSSKVIDLWLNTVFAHGGIKGRTKRSEFEAAADKYGHGRFEYAFRVLVKWSGEMFQFLSREAGKPALEFFTRDKSLRPSFKMGAAFGTKRKEVMPNGELIIRQASSEHFSEETFEQRFQRVLKRLPFDNLHSIIKNIDRTSVEVIKATFAASSLEEFLLRLEGRLEVVPDEAANPTILAEGFCASCTVHANYSAIYGGAMISRQATVRTTEAAVPVLNSQFVKFRQELLTE